MKRFFIILLGVLLLCPYAFSQSKTPDVSISYPLDSDEAVAPDSDNLSTPVVDNAISVEEPPQAVSPEQQPLATQAVSPEPPLATQAPAEQIPEPPVTVSEVEEPPPAVVPQTTKVEPPPVVPVTTRVEPASSLVPGRDIRVIPGMPNPNSGKIYKLQVGAYAVAENADQSAALLRSGGFRVAREMFESKHRVLAEGIAAADVYAAVQKIGDLGFSVVWVRE